MTLFWIKEDNDNLQLQHGMFACKHFTDRKIAENIDAELDEILISAGLQPDLVPVTTDKSSNIVAATSHTVRIDCACHRLHTAIESAWEKAKAAYSTLKELDESCHKLV